MAFWRNRHELLRLFESLDKGGDHTGIFILDEVIEILLHRHAGLVAAGNDMTEADVAIEHHRVGDGRAKAAALRNERDRARKKPCGMSEANSGALPNTFNTP